ncbi:MAG: hypothetical protein RLY83_17 [Actinomycetota bacterium]|jgi:hypothetical protein
MKKSIKVLAGIFAVGLLTACAPAAPKYSGAQVMMSAVNWKCSNPPSDAWHDLGAWTDVTPEGAEPGDTTWTYNGYGDYESAEPASLARNSFIITKSEKGYKIYGPSSILLAKKWECDQIILVGLELVENSKGELVPTS